jgi:serine/threonine protein kinase
MLKAGTILQNRYRIEKQIGQGGMGAVYVAVDQRFGSTVAIKETLFLGENFEKAFEREARLLNSLRHPALPQVRDYFSEEHNQYLVMEFIPGEDLAERLEKNGRAFELDTVLDWTRQLLEALDFLHTQEIPVIHRDIKPQNLKLTPKGQIILLDFGLAKGNPTDASHLTNAKSIFGYSRNYASLEQMQGTGTDPRSDLYSLAATVYHLLTGTSPVDALTRAMSVLNEQPDPLVPADRLHAQVPKGLANVLHMAMDLNASQRPESARQMLEMLENSEQYADLFPAPAPSVAKAVPTSFLDQKTRLLPENRPSQTSAAKADFSTGDGERETEVNINDLSSDAYVTNVVGASDAFERPKGGRGLKMFYGAAAVFSLLLVIVGASAAFYMSENEPAEPKNLLNTAEPVSKPVASQPDADTAVTDKSGQNMDEAAPPEKVETAENPSSKEESPAKAARTANQTKAGADETTGSGKRSVEEEADFVIVDPEEGEVIFKGNKIETDRLIIDDKGVIFKKPPFPPVPPKDGTIKLSPEELKRLTPEQLQRLNKIKSALEQRQKNLEKNKTVVQPPPPPTPE